MGLADGANLCAQAHSSASWAFTVCMYSNADPNGDKDKDVKNPLAHTSTFDVTVTKCASKTLKDYKTEDLLKCVHGSEGAALRKASAGKTPMSKFRGPVWGRLQGKSSPRLLLLDLASLI